MMRSTPITSRLSTTRFTSCEAPSQQLRCQYSLGSMSSFATALCVNGYNIDSGRERVVAKLVGFAQDARDPGVQGLGEHELQAWMALEHAPESEVREAAVVPPLALEHRDRRSLRPVLGSLGVAHDDGVSVNRHVHLRAHGPERIESVLVERYELPEMVGGDEDAPQSRFLGPLHLVDCVIEVIEEHLGEPGATAGPLVAEVDHPAVVCLDSGPAQPVFLGGRGCWCTDDRRRVEGWHGVGEHDLGGDPVIFEVLERVARCPSCTAT